MTAPAPAPPLDLAAVRAVLARLRETRAFTDRYLVFAAPYDPVTMRKADVTSAEFTAYFEGIATLVNAADALIAVAEAAATERAARMAWDEYKTRVVRPGADWSRSTAGGLELAAWDAVDALDAALAALAAQAGGRE